MGPVESAFTTYKHAVAAKDVDLLVELFDEQALLFDVWNQWSMSGRAAWRSAVGEWFASLGTDTVEVDFEKVGETSTEEMACVSAFVTYAAVSSHGERLRSHRERQTWVLVRREVEWRIVHCHNSVPIDMESGKPRSDE